jgi:hypothetical protein
MMNCFVAFACALTSGSFDRRPLASALLVSSPRRRDCSAIGVSSCLSISFSWSKASSGFCRASSMPWATASIARLPAACADLIHDLP